MVGFVVSIHAESDHEEQRLKADFISRLQERINAEELNGVIDLNVLKNHVAESRQTYESIRQLRKRIGGHFYIYGKVKRRLNPQNTYFLELSGIVFHAPLDQRNSDILRDDFDVSLPRRVQFLEAFEFQGFQYSADSTWVAARYVTGIAAYFSRDPVLAKKLHMSLKSELEKIASLPPNLEKVRQRIPILLSGELLSIAEAELDRGETVKAKESLKQAFVYDPKNYPAMLFQAIVDFQIDSDPRKAIAHLEEAIRYRGRDETVFLSLAFLHFWLANYKRALELCDRLERTDRDNYGNIARQAMDFNLRLKKEGRFKDQLYFWLGFLNYKMLVNLPTALEYFERFLELAGPEMDLLSDKARSYIFKIKEVMELS